MSDNDIEEREAAVCPEDMSFEEYIGILKRALRPFAAMYQEGLAGDEAALCRNGKMLLNRDIERAYKLVGDYEPTQAELDEWYRSIAEPYGGRL